MHSIDRNENIRRRSSNQVFKHYLRLSDTIKQRSSETNQIDVQFFDNWSRNDWEISRDQRQSHSIDAKLASYQSVMIENYFDNNVKYIVRQVLNEVDTISWDDDERLQKSTTITFKNTNCDWQNLEETLSSTRENDRRNMSNHNEWHSIVARKEINWYFKQSRLSNIASKSSNWAKQFVNYQLSIRIFIFM